MHKKYQKIINYLTKYQENYVRMSLTIKLLEQDLMLSSKIHFWEN